MTKNIIDNIKEKRDIKDTSLKTYRCSLSKLSKELKGNGLDDNKFLYDYNKVMTVIDKENKITSKKQINLYYSVIKM